VAEPRAPYPPDLDDDAREATLLDALDGRIENGEFANERVVRSSLRRVELHLCRLTGVDLAEATWIDVVLTDCRADLAGFRYAKLERVVFRDCRLEEADFGAASFKDVRFERCALQRASFASSKNQRLRFERCDLTGASGVDALRGASMRFDDVLQNAPVFAQALGIEILAED
jgi:uncharacterized protein YjbI with pentapeptide repeats